jgi:hypothetical protein
MAAGALPDRRGSELSEYPQSGDVADARTIDATRSVRCDREPPRRSAPWHETCSDGDMCLHTFTAIRVGVLCLIPLAGIAAGDDSQTITALATVKTAGGASTSAPLTVVVRQLTTDAERDELIAALKQGGTASARALLAKRPDLGTVRLGARQTAIKYAYARQTGGGELVTVVTVEPIVFLGAGLPDAKPVSGYDLGLVMLEVAASGPGRGELVPATKVRTNDDGAIVTEDYSAEVVQLSNVVRKPGDGKR